MVDVNYSDRRLHPRLDHGMPISVMTDGYDFMSTTRNISCLGAYCHIEKYVPPFTRLSIKLQLPVKPRASRKLQVACKGVVVRTDDDPSGGFNIAVFFNDIKPTQQHRIAEYINQFLPR